MVIFDAISFSCPLVLGAVGALFSEYAGLLALFLDGLMTLSGFFMFLFTDLTASPVLGAAIAVLLSVGITVFLSLVVEKTRANPFIASLGMNLFFGALVSLLSSIFYHTRGVLSSSNFEFLVSGVKAFTIIVSVLLTAGAICFLKFSQKGIYVRITGSDSDVLSVKGVNPSVYRIFSWGTAGFFSAWGGIFLALRISSFVPNLAGGKGWMALAAVFLGKKKIWRIVLFLVIFCAADILSSHIQIFLPSVPSSVLLSFPYLIAIMLSCIK